MLPWFIRNHLRSILILHLWLFISITARRNKNKRLRREFGARPINKYSSEVVTLHDKKLTKQKPTRKKHLFSQKNIRENRIRENLIKKKQIHENKIIQNDFNDTSLNGTLYDIVIIGSGIAGLTSALYVARLGRGQQIVLGGDDGQVGGELVLTDSIENYPGFYDALPGLHLAKRVEKQANKFGVQIIGHAVDRLNLTDQPFMIKTNENLEIFAKSLIVATGATENWLDAPGELLLKGEYIHTCALCDAMLYTNQKVVIVGGGDTAMESAAYLSRIANSVIVIHRRDSWRASTMLVEKAKQLDNVELMTPYTVKKWITSGSKLTGVLIEVSDKEHPDYKQTTQISCNGAFINIGSTPKTEFFQNQVLLDDKGFVVLTENTMTSVPGVFGAGQVADPIYRQAITAAGMGARAAIDTDRWLQKNGHFGKISEEQKKKFKQNLKRNFEKKKGRQNVKRTVVEEVSYNSKGKIPGTIDRKRRNNPHEKIEESAGCDLAVRACFDKFVLMHPLIMFERNSCPSCIRAKNILDIEGVKPYSVYLDGGIHSQKVRKHIADIAKKRSVPMIWIDGKYFGGMRNIIRAHEKNELKNILQKANVYK